MTLHLCEDKDPWTPDTGWYQICGFRVAIRLCLPRVTYQWNSYSPQKGFHNQISFFTCFRIFNMLKCVRCLQGEDSMDNSPDLLMLAPF